MILQIILGTFLSWCAAKAIKLAQDIINEKRFDLRFLFHDGGMPSAHTSAIVGLATSVLLDEGLTTAFMICFVVALIVMNDATKVRWITGEQSKAINKLTKGKSGFSKLEERVGHTKAEVAIGMLIGIIVPMIIYAIW